MKRGVQHLGRAARRLPAGAVVIGTLYALSDGSRWVLVAGIASALGLLLLHGRRQAERSGPVHEQPDHLIANEAKTAQHDVDERAPLVEDELRWDYDYERTLEDLVLELVGRDVRVLVGARTDRWWPAAEMSGTLDHVVDIAPDGHPDELLWLGVNGGSGVVLPREAFAGAARIDDDEDVGVALRLGDSLLWILDDEASRNRAALTRERRETP